MIVEQPYLTRKQKEDIFAIWNEEYPVEIHYENVQAFESYLSNLEDIKHYLQLSDDRVIAWLAIFIRNEELWFAILISRKNQGKGTGTLLMNHLLARHDILNAWMIESENYHKADGSAYRSPAGFYRRLGFKKCDDRLIAEIECVKIQWKKDVIE